jgi:hypothetical protein
MHPDGRYMGQPGPGGAPGGVGAPYGGTPPGMAAPGSGRWAPPKPSRALPIAVAAGLAAGVFGGLLVVRGTETASAETAAGAGAGAGTGTGTSTGTGPEPGTGTGTGTLTEPGTGTGTGTGSDAGTGVGIGTAPDAGAVEATVKDPQPAVTRAALTFVVDPPDAEVLVDGAALSEPRFTVELAAGTSRRIKVEARARGYRSHAESLTVEGDRTVEIKLKKKPRGGGNGGGAGSGPGGLIDL